MKTHEELKNAAAEAIDALNADTRVSMHETLDDLEELRERINSCRAAIREDIAREEREDGK